MRDEGHRPGFSSFFILPPSSLVIAQAQELSKHPLSWRPCSREFVRGLASEPLLAMGDMVGAVTRPGYQYCGAGSRLVSVL